METLQSYLGDQWGGGTGEPVTLVNPATEEAVAQTSTEGLDRAGALEHARRVGGPALRAMTFAERGEMLKALADAVVAKRSELLELSMVNNGATRGDAKFDVDGASLTLNRYAELGHELGDRRWLLDGEVEQLLGSRRLGGLHVKVPRRGVAVHVNAFNFPAWNLAEKAAVAWLAGMPVLSKPAAPTAWTSYELARALVESGALPNGAFAFLAGDPGDLVDHLGPSDVLAFTGSSATGSWLRTRSHLAERGVPVHVEADSLNAAVVGPDVEPGSETWDALVRDVFREMTQKTGQKCTATRRVMVPAERADELVEALIEQARGLRIGDPRAEGVRMGPVVSAAQRDEVLAGIRELEGAARLVHGQGRPAEVAGVDEGRGYFVDVHLLRTADPQASLEADAVHRREVFGPVATVLPYDGSVEQARRLVAMGGGELVASLYGDDRSWTRELALELAPWAGRVTLGSEKSAPIAPGPGMVIPDLVHGGPGRAGGGEELGGLRGLDRYLQRTAIQGYRPLLERLFDER